MPRQHEAKSRESLEADIKRHQNKTTGDPIYLPALWLEVAFRTIHGCDGYTQDIDEAKQSSDKIPTESKHYPEGMSMLGKYFLENNDHRAALPLLVNAYIAGRRNLFDDIATAIVGWQKSETLTHEVLQEMFGDHPDKQRELGSFYLEKEYYRAALPLLVSSYVTGEADPSQTIPQAIEGLATKGELTLEDLQHAFVCYGQRLSDPGWSGFSLIDKFSENELTPTLSADSHPEHKAIYLMAFLLFVEAELMKDGESLSETARFFFKPSLTRVTGNRTVDLVSIEGNSAFGLILLKDLNLNRKGFRKTDLSLFQFYNLLSTVVLSKLCDDGYAHLVYKMATLSHHFGFLNENRYDKLIDELYNTHNEDTLDEETWDLISERKFEREKLRDSYLYTMTPGSKILKACQEKLDTREDVASEDTVTDIKGHLNEILNAVKIRVSKASSSQGGVFANGDELSSLLNDALNLLEKNDEATATAESISKVIKALPNVDDSFFKGTKNALTTYLQKLQANEEFVNGWQKVDQQQADVG